MRIEDTDLSAFEVSIASEMLDFKGQFKKVCQNYKSNKK
jgi:hypothetical protein